MELKILEPVCPSMDHQNGHGQLTRILLKGEVPIDGDEGIKSFGRLLEQFSILDTSPAGLLNCFDVMPL